MNMVHPNHIIHEKCFDFSSLSSIKATTHRSVNKLLRGCDLKNQLRLNHKFMTMLLQRSALATQQHERLHIQQALYAPSVYSHHKHTCLRDVS